jgi:peptidoglycan/LPS O-acetylase OafA/YrhL
MNSNSILNTIGARSLSLDLLKCVAIIAVVLYHVGICEYGYLGVDVFLVIAGYLTTKSIIRQQDNGSFGYFRFLNKRIFRLIPLLLIVSVLSLVLGYVLMLPMALKNTAESAAATPLFLNNVVQYITSADYWNGNNDYKPLMHTWYVALLMQFYVVYALLLLLGKKLGGGKKYIYVIGFMFMASLLYYLIQTNDASAKFYLLPARMFEFAAGGGVALNAMGILRVKGRLTAYLLLLLLVALLFVNGSLESGQVKLVVSTIFTCALLVLPWDKSLNDIKSKSARLLVGLFASLGAASYSFYLWHQVIIAFYRYVINDDFAVSDYLIIFALCIIIGWLSYRYVERGLDNVKRLKWGKVAFNIVSVIVLIVIVGCSYKWYKQNGLVRDIPELELYVATSGNIESQDYNQRNESMDVDFHENGKQNVLVVGDSFARDWINVLKEAGIDSTMNISLHRDADAVLNDRIAKADYVFVANNAPFDTYYPYLKRMMEKRFFRVGRKNYTSRNGIVYNNDRYGKDYYSQTFSLQESEEKEMKEEKLIFGDKYIDLMGSIQQNNGEYAFFTPDKHFYSHDGIHLTHAGAKEYARRLNVKKYFN